MEEDTEFLAKYGLVDYSMLFRIGRVSNVGILQGHESRTLVEINNILYFQDNNEWFVVVFYIIDYLCEFTDFKKMESNGKRYILGRDYAEVTILPPREYRRRFLYASVGIEFAGKKADHPWFIFPERNLIHLRILQSTDMETRVPQEEMWISPPVELRSPWTGDHIRQLCNGETAVRKILSEEFCSAEPLSEDNIPLYPLVSLSEIYGI